MKIYHYLVEHPELGEVRVDAVDKLRAVSAAAQIWGVPWTGIARQCMVTAEGVAEIRDKVERGGTGGDGPGGSGDRKKVPGSKSAGAGSVSRAGSGGKKGKAGPAPAKKSAEEGTGRGGKRP